MKIIVFGLPLYFQLLDLEQKRNEYSPNLFNEEFGIH